jgi:type II secretory pathway pseudopilin PulG
MRIKIKKDLYKKMKRLTNNNVVELGRSMIEMLGVLAIVGVLTVTAIKGYTSAMDRVKKNSVVDEINSIYSVVAESGMTEGDYFTAIGATVGVATATNTTGNISSLVQAALNSRGKAPTNPWKGAYGLVTGTNAATGTMFGVYLTGLPPGCVGLADTSMSGSVSADGVTPGAKGYCLAAAPTGLYTSNPTSVGTGTVFVVFFK